MKWQAQANCGPDNAHLFDPVVSHPGTDARRHDRERQRRAAAVCSTCTVTARCLQLALMEGLSGTFGGVYVNGGQIARVER